MVKQKIKSAQPMANPNGIIVETYEGLKGSCWDKELQKVLTANVGKDVDILIQPNKAGYDTVMSVIPITEEMAHAQEVVAQVQQPLAPPIVEKSASGLSFRDEVIIAQVMLKEANNMACVAVSKLNEGLTNEQYGEMLAHNINELTGAYKLALHNLSIL